MSIFRRLDVVIDDNHGTFLVADGPDNAIVGSLMLIHKDRRSATVFQLYVAPEHRRHGVGTSLVEEAALIARLSHCETIAVEMIKTNAIAALFYKSLGFEFAYEANPTSIIMTKRL